MNCSERPTPRLLVVHPGALGDVLLALPALAHLGALTPGAERVLAAAPRIAALLDGSPYAERALPLDGFGLHRLFLPDPDAALLGELAAYDAVVSWLGAGDAACREALARLGRPVVVARTAPDPGARRHASRQLLDTLAPLGPVPDELPRVCLPVRPAERAWATAWLTARGISRGEAILLHPGAGAPAKVWPGHPELARRLVAAGLPLVVLAGPADAAAVEAVVGASALPAGRLARDLELGHVAALCEAARVFVGNDSGLTHLAAAVGCPVLALFGPTDPDIWAPGGPPGVSPTTRVPHGPGRGSADSWAGLTVSRAEGALAELLEATLAIAG